MMLISLFGVKLGWLPFSGWTPTEVGPDFDFKTDFLLFEPLAAPAVRRVPLGV